MTNSVLAVPPLLFMAFVTQDRVKQARGARAIANEELCRMRAAIVQAQQHLAAASQNLREADGVVRKVLGR